jgi:hypothetical protein
VQYATGAGPFPERLPELQLTGRFVTGFYLLVGQRARWAATIVQGWPDDPRQARPDPGPSPRSSAAPLTEPASPRLPRHPIRLRGGTGGNRS